MLQEPRGYSGRLPAQKFSEFIKCYRGLLGKLQGFVGKITGVCWDECALRSANDCEVHSVKCS